MTIGKTHPTLLLFRPLRAQHQQLQKELKESKRKYDSALAGLEAGRGNLEREVNQIRKQHTKERAEFHIQSQSCKFGQKLLVN